MLFDNQGIRVFWAVHPGARTARPRGRESGRFAIAWWMDQKEGCMLISSKGRYALRLMIYIAAFGDEEGKIALREVSEREKISLKYLEQLVRPLMHAELLRSVRGKGGGYVLARPADEITAGDILRAAEGTTATVACDGLEGACTRADLCSTVKFWTGLEKAIDDYVDGVTLADLARAPEIHLDIERK